LRLFGRERDREFTVEKPADTIRIAVIGDSITYGCCFYPVETTFSRRMELLLNDEGSSGNYQTMNGGVCGYNAIQVAEFYRTRIAPLHPDHVIYELTLNDHHAIEYDFVQILGEKDATTANTLLEYYKMGQSRLFADSYLFRQLVYLVARIKAVGATEVPPEARIIEQPDFLPEIPLASTRTEGSPKA
jgi:lysophospholipase L1-like esterase